MQQPPFYLPPPPSPKQRFFNRPVPTWLFLVTIILVAIVVFFAARSLPNSPSNTSASTTTQTSSSSNGDGGNTTSSDNGNTPVQVTVTSSTKWKTVKSFSSTGDLKTDQMTMTAPWRLAASCVPNSWDGLSFNLSADIYQPDGHFFDGAINYICSEGDQNESFVEYYGGTYYLRISGEGTWSLDVQEIDQ